MARELDDTIRDAKRELRERIELRMAAENMGLATDTPALGPAFDGSPTPVNIIAANVFEAIEEALWEEIREIQSEREDEEATNEPS